MITSTKRRSGNGAARTHSRDTFPGQIVLVLQGGGALGAYQVGVYEALHEAGVEPDWVIGTSIGAINGAIIAGNLPASRMERLEEFWRMVRSDESAKLWGMWPAVANAVRTGEHRRQGHRRLLRAERGRGLGRARAAGRREARVLQDLAAAGNAGGAGRFRLRQFAQTRLTLGAVNVRTSEMRYFDSRDMAIDERHVMASGALPPAFPAVRIDGDPYWDGGIYSNTPVEVVLDDKPRKDTLIFAANVWHATAAGARDHLAGDGPAEGHPVCEPRHQPRPAPAADPPHAPHHPRTCNHVPEKRRTPR